jgi:hypothetical protein
MDWPQAQLAKPCHSRSSRRRRPPQPPAAAAAATRRAGTKQRRRRRPRTGRARRTHKHKGQRQDQEARRKQARPKRPQEARARPQRATHSRRITQQATTKKQEARGSNAATPQSKAGAGRRKGKAGKRPEVPAVRAARHHLSRQRTAVGKSARPPGLDPDIQFNRKQATARRLSSWLRRSAEPRIHTTITESPPSSASPCQFSHVRQVSLTLAMRQTPSAEPRPCVKCPLPRPCAKYATRRLKAAEAFSRAFPCQCHNTQHQALARQCRELK